MSPVRWSRGARRQGANAGPLIAATVLRAAPQPWYSGSRTTPMAWLADLDATVFLWLNHQLACAPLDALMRAISDARLYPPLLAACAAALIVKYRTRGLVAVLTAAAALALTDAFGSDVLKPWIARPRPFLVLSDVRLLVTGAAPFGMPSLHAANAAAMATVVWCSARFPGAFALAAAVLVGLSRIYVGVHWPGDVLVGFVLGAAVASLVVRFERLLRARLAYLPAEKCEAPPVADIDLRDQRTPQ